MIRVIGLDHFVLRVRDLERTLGFYRDLLGLPVEFLDEYRQGLRPFVSVRTGGSLIDFVPDATYDPAAAVPAGGFLHLCLQVDGQLADIAPWLRQRGITLLDEQPVPRMGATGLGLSLYVRDPDDYMVELKEHSS